MPQANTNYTSLLPAERTSLREGKEMCTQLTLPRLIRYDARLFCARIIQPNNQSLQALLLAKFQTRGHSPNNDSLYSFNRDDTDICPGVQDNTLNHSAPVVAAPWRRVRIDMDIRGVLSGLVDW
jgi:hypothetical protein